MAISKIGLGSRTYRHVNRYRQILSVLLKYGFGGLVDRMRISQYLELGLKIVAHERQQHIEKLSTAERVRLALEELGPTFIKLGQVLSTRPDLIPPEFATELARLQQEVPPFPLEKVRAIIADELGQPLEDAFEHFEPRSMAAASIGQVHRARLHGGDEVVVKVQRPGIEQTVEVDLEILLHLAMLIERHLEDLRRYRPTRIVEEFSRVLERELDFRTEAAHLDRFADNFQNDETIYIPKVYREHTTRRVLTLEYVPVIPITDLEAVRTAGLDPKVLAFRGTELTLKQLFVHGYFHADPHPGNVFALPGNIICLLDFGMIGRLDRRGREDFADLLHAIARRDPEKAAGALLRLTSSEDNHEPNQRQIEADVAEFIDVNIPASLADLDFSKLVRQLFELVHRHRLTVPPDLVMMLKAAATVERLVVRLDPSLNLIEAAKPYVQRLKLERLRPSRMLGDVVDFAGGMIELVREIPGSFRDLLRLAKRGELRIGFEHRGLGQMLEVHERISNRLSFAIVVAALIIGSSLIVLSRIPPTWHEIPVVGLVGFLVAGVVGLLLLISIIRHGRL